MQTMLETGEHARSRSELAVMLGSLLMTSLNTTLCSDLQPLHSKSKQC